jgi:hypothetical protein
MAVRLPPGGGIFGWAGGDDPAVRPAVNGRWRFPKIRASFAKPCADAGGDQAHTGALARAAAAIQQLLFPSFPVSLCFRARLLGGC